jgi:hypothetical protein
MLVFRDYSVRQELQRREDLVSKKLRGITLMGDGRHNLIEFCRKDANNLYKGEHINFLFITYIKLGLSFYLFKKIFEVFY